MNPFFSVGVKYNLDISFVILRLVEQENISSPKNKSVKKDPLHSTSKPQEP